MTIEVFYESEGIIYASSDSVGTGKNKFYYHKNSNSIIAHAGKSFMGKEVLNYIKDKEINNIKDLVNELEHYINNSIKHDIDQSESYWIVCGYVDFISVYYNIIYYKYNTQIKNGNLNNTLIYNGANEILEYKYPKEILESELCINLNSKKEQYNNDIVNALNKYIKNCIDKNLTTSNEISTQLMTDYPIQYMVINNTGLIKKGETEGKYESDTISYLFTSIKNKNIPNIMKYIDSNKDINKYDILTRVINTLNDKILSIFLKHGLDINIKNKNNETYLSHLIGKYNHDNRHEKYITGLIKFLIQYGADLDTINNDGYTPLHMASMKGHPEIVEFLIEYGVDVNVKDDVGYTPLHMASMKGYTEIVKTLIENGADVNAKNKYGKTALDIAKEKGHTEIVKILMNKSM